MLRELAKKTKQRLGFIEPTIPNPKSTDVYLISYPKSGNTWMRYLLAHAIWPEINRPDLQDMAALIPSFGIDYDKRAMLDPGSPCNRLEHRVIKEHFPYNRVARKYVKNVIYLCRDGRDAVVSYWYFWNQMKGTQLSLQDFIRESASHSYGSWQAHVEQWLNAPVNRLIIRYEDLLRDPGGCLEQALKFIKLKRNETTIDQAVQLSSFQAMKEIENTKGFNLDMIDSVTFVRKGEAGAWKELMDPETFLLFRRYHGSGISKLGYNW